MLDIVVELIKMVNRVLPPYPKRVLKGEWGVGAEEKTRHGVLAGMGAGSGFGAACCQSPPPPPGAPRSAQGSCGQGSLEGQDFVTVPAQDWDGGQGCSLSQPTSSSPAPP